MLKPPLGPRFSSQSKAWPAFTLPMFVQAPKWRYLSENPVTPCALQSQGRETGTSEGDSLLDALLLSIDYMGTKGGNDFNLDTTSA